MQERGWREGSCAVRRLMRNRKGEVRARASCCCQARERLAVPEEERMRRDEGEGGARRAAGGGGGRVGLRDRRRREIRKPDAAEKEKQSLYSTYVRYYGGARSDGVKRGGGLCVPQKGTLERAGWGGGRKKTALRKWGWGKKQRRKTGEARRQKRERLEKKEGACLVL